MISLRNVSKSYPMNSGQRRVLLENVTMTLPEGNVAVIGRNGAGKSTLLRMIAGTERTDRGDIRRDGTVSWPIGFRGSFHPALTGRENLRFVARIYGRDPEAITAYVDEFSELGPFLDRPVETYSSGMGARLAFGLSMAVEFDIYLVDEVMGVGDQRFQKKCSLAFGQAMSRARIIMVSHSMAKLRDYCQSAIVLHDRQIHVCASLEEGIEVYEELARRPMVY